MQKMAYDHVLNLSENEGEVLPPKVLTNKRGRPSGNVIRWREKQVS